jgi:hypothetical protein
MVMTLVVDQVECDHDRVCHLRIAHWLCRRHRRDVCDDVRVC